MCEVNEWILYENNSLYSHGDLIYDAFEMTWENDYVVSVNFILMS